jgi:hypothetical protein
MARVFNATFNYKEADYTAIVTIDNSEEEKKIIIDVPDNSLHGVLPGGKIILEGEAEIQKNAQTTGSDPLLIQTLKEVVEEHEKDKPSRGLWC